MNTLLVQEFLKTNTFGELISQHGIYPSISKSGHKFSLNYDQIEAKDNDPMVLECRGLILATENNPLPQTDYNDIIPGDTTVLAYPMRRFYNIEQECAAKINYNSDISIQNKYDGTLCIVYYDTFIKKWCVATRSCPDADIVMNSGIYTFRQLFEKGLEEEPGLTFDEFTSNLSKYYTYCFELTSPYNIVVVNYSNIRLTLLAIRDLRSNKEISTYDNPINGIQCAKRFYFNSLNELIEWNSKQDPLDHEGVVVVDRNFNRVKVKSPLYVAIHGTVSSVCASERNCLKIVLSDKYDDIIGKLPKAIAERLTGIRTNVVKLINKYDSLFKEVKEFSEDRKTFALYANSKTKWTSPLFKMLTDNISMNEFLCTSRFSNTFLDKVLEEIKEFENV